MTGPPPSPPPDADADRAEVTEPKLAREEQQPQAQGTLEETPLVYILVFLLGRALSGRLTLRDAGGGTVLMRFRDGAPVSIDMSAPVALLGEELVKAGYLAPPSLGATIARAAGVGQRLGEHMVDEGRMSGEVVTRLLSTQLEARFALLVGLPPETEFTFHVQTLPPPRRFEPWDPLNALLATVRAWEDRRRIHATVRWLAARPLTLHPVAIETLKQLKLTPKEQNAMALMRDESAPANLDALYREHGEGLSSLLYTLAVTRQFAFSADKGPPMGLGRASAPPPAPSTVPSVPPPPPDVPEEPPKPVSRKSGPLPMPSGVSAAEPLAPPVMPRTVTGAHRAVASPPVPSPPAPPPRSPLPPPPPPAVLAPPPPPSPPPPPPPAPPPPPPPPASSSSLPAQVSPPAPARPPPRAPPARPSTPKLHTPSVAPQVPAARPSIAPAPGESASTIAPGGLSQSVPFIDVARERPEKTPAGRALPPPPPLARPKAPLTGSKAPPAPPPPRPVRPASVAPAQPAGDPRKNAQEDFRLAEEALARNDLKEAETRVLLATKGDPDVVEYAALYAWVQSQAGVPLPESVRTFSRILEDHPECQTALYYRGMLLKQAGKDRPALKDFVTVVRLNPDHNKALAEVKLLRARLKI